jgi:hypothetical protein
MTLYFRIFHPEKKKGWNLTFSERLSNYSLLIAFCLGIILYFIEDKWNTTIPDYFSWILVIAFFGHVLSFIIRLKEHENINGFFEGNIRFESEYIETNNTRFFYKDIFNLKVSVGDYYGKPTGNYRYGPNYRNGLSNFISFTVEDEHQEFYFEINAEFLIEYFYNNLVTIICQEKLKYNRNYLDSIPSSHRDSTQFQKFMTKLLKEKEISCTEGLLIMGYSSDEEAKEMRAKYCS